VDSLQQEQLTDVGQSQQLAVKNESLTKEAERLRYLEQIRAVPVWNQTSNAQSGPSNSAVPGRSNVSCFNCGQPGHFSRNSTIPRQQNRGFLKLKSRQLL